MIELKWTVRVERFLFVTLTEYIGSLDLQTTQTVYKRIYPGLSVLVVLD